MAHRIEIYASVPDTRAQVLKNRILSFQFSDHDVAAVELVDVYTVDKELTAEELEKSASILANPVTQTYSIDDSHLPAQFDWAIEIGFLPGVTDNVGNTAHQSIADLIRRPFTDGEAIYSTQLLYITGTLAQKDIDRIGAALSNPIIQRTQSKTGQQCRDDHGMGTIVPRVTLGKSAKTDIVNVFVTDEELEQIGKNGITDHFDPDGTPVYRGPLALDLPSMKVITDYFSKTEKRQPTDAELETLGQTWSEHCKHTIFAGSLDDIHDGLYKHFIRRATTDVRQNKGKQNFCVSVFTDNSGAIAFDGNYLITDKAETHNSPSALDPFGGAVTGIVGVNRDTIGFGLGAKPIANTYGFCFADPRSKPKLYRGKDKTSPMLSPRRIMEGVVAGVNNGGNCSGIPTPQGFVYFHPNYAGKPLVFVRTVGLIPWHVQGKLSHEKKAEVGDAIVMIGGRVGKDGIHGATFSSEALTSGSPATAVQIGDPITQKKFSDAVVKEARDLGLYHSITDNGAGGLSSSIGEMARDTNGCLVKLDLVPLKYPGLAPWEIWISESQERMSLAVPQDRVDEFISLMHRRDVEATVIGEFTNTGRCIVSYKNQNVVDMDLEFMHFGLPHKTLTSTTTEIRSEQNIIPVCTDFAALFIDMTRRLNVCSSSFISYQYDYVVQGTSALQPLQGRGKVNADASVLRPLLPPLEATPSQPVKGPKTYPPSLQGIALSQALYPTYSELDTYHMAACSIDGAIRNVVAVGADPDRIALMDNFCWCSPEDPARLGQLKRACEACYDYAVAFGTPFISGKDSMYNDFKGFDAISEPIKLSIPPTLLISSLGILPDVTRAVSLDAKMPGDLVYVLGMTRREMGGSEYYAYVGEKEKGTARRGNVVPQVDAASALKLYRTYYEAVNRRLLASGIALGIGGLAVALLKTALGGKLGLSIDLKRMLSRNIEREDYLLFAESASRLLVTVAPQNQAAFEKMFEGQYFARIGEVTAEPELIINGLKGLTIIDIQLAALEKSYFSPLADF